MKRLLPHPVLTITLVVLWLALTGPSLGQLILGVVIAVATSRHPGCAAGTRWSNWR